MSRVVSIRLPASLYALLERHAKSRGINVTEAARDLVRRGVGAVKSARESGYEEGRLAGWRDHMKRMNGVE
jgi:hypothetical protein